MDQHTADELRYKNGYNDAKQKYYKETKWIHAGDRFQCMRCGRNYEPALAEDKYCPGCGAKIVSDF